MHNRLLIVILIVAGASGAFLWTRHKSNETNATMKSHASISHFPADVMPVREQRAVFEPRPAIAPVAGKNEKKDVLDQAAYTQSSDEEVIGRPFPLSVSVTSQCLQMRDKAVFCDGVLNDLEELAQEPRDSVWASAAEEAIRSRIVLEPTVYTVRSLECRLTLCAVEWSNLAGNHLDFGNDFLVRNRLRHGDILHAYERDSSHARVVVNVATFRKR